MEDKRRPEPRSRGNSQRSEDQALAHGRGERRAGGRDKAGSGGSAEPAPEPEPNKTTAERAVLARIMRGSTRFKSRRGPAAEWSNSRDPKTAGELLEELIAVEGWQADAAAGLLLADWAKIVGPQVAAHCQVVSLEDGQLTVKADSSPWAAEIRLLAPQLQSAVDQYVGAGVVTAVQVLGPEGRPRTRRRR
ncbi:MAG: DUF721 domain-containing protein [Bifidobacteriaceae bacterium]|jgi:predicted nucleic acid-binding Zn ribbon protein|nr:DUF721 domain-containing protein [Bifidobacteriaceae bacterium]